MEKREVRIISERAKYRRYTYPAIPRWDDQLATYITGQHKHPGNPDGLTKDEMTGAVELTAKKRAKYEYLIVPEKPHHIMHMRRFDLSVDEDGKPINAKDYWDFEFFKTLDVVAPDKKSFIHGGKHIFYIEDKTAEAVEEVNSKRLEFKAMQKIMENASVESYQDISILLNHFIPNFNINVSASTALMLEHAILKACSSNPADVLKCFEKESQDILFVLKLMRYGIIARRDSSFFDGSLFLGNSPQEVVQFGRTKDGSGYYTKWTKMLNKYEKRVTPEDVNA